MPQVPTVASEHQMHTDANRRTVLLHCAEGVDQCVQIIGCGATRMQSTLHCLWGPLSRA